MILCENQVDIATQAVRVVMYLAASGITISSIKFATTGRSAYVYYRNTKRGPSYTIRISDHPRTSRRSLTQISRGVLHTLHFKREWHTIRRSVRAFIIRSRQIDHAHTTA